ncbi:MAG: hypothetical protein H7210_06670 [Pyrinomonadaceae bacterium]|nr:hypothetical protein [Phycisphaerales bacterium]
MRRPTHQRDDDRPVGTLLPSLRLWLMLLGWAAAALTIAYMLTHVLPTWLAWGLGVLLYLAPFLALFVFAYCPLPDESGAFTKTTDSMPPSDHENTSQDSEQSQADR